MFVAYPRLRRLPETIDLLVAAVAGSQLPELVEEIIESRKVTSVILIPGGMGEKEGTENIAASVKDAIESSRGRSDGGPIFLGGNCMGLRSRPGRYGHVFHPAEQAGPAAPGPRRDGRR